MNTLEEQKSKKEEYNAEPVYYCKHCLSLITSYVPSIEDSDFCVKCGSTDIGICSIEEWEELYKALHNGVRYLDNNYYKK